jgi:hypothetical protein
MDAQRLVQYVDDAPASEPMRAQQRRVRSNPSPEDRKVRNRQQRSQRTPQPRTAALQCLACGCMGHGAARGSMCPACGSLAVQATRLDTQIERLTEGDQLLTPQGQSVNVKKVRPHETESGKVYVDTDMGTSIMDRGTNVKYVPKGGHSSVQQELPNSGNPQANVGRMPGAGDMTPAQAPMCPVDGTRMVFRNNTWICPKDGTTAPTSAAPAGMAPTDWGHGQMVNRQPGRPVQRAHVWGAFITTERPSLVAREAQRVLSTMEENRS